jgi:tRNA A-37 threonylcarbamoyl transferase component Bud32
MTTMPKPKDLKGQRVGRYTLVDHLASGGMAEIFLARHEAEGEFSKDLVLKILQSRYLDNEAVVAMFLDEARLAARLNHPNIVDVYDVGIEEGLYYIAMEHIPGKTLTDVMRRGIEVSQPLPLDHAVYLVAETAAGLAYMHDGTDARGIRFGIVHRDISPSNLVVSFSGQTKIIDFGIARDAGASERQKGARPGKVSYMSPEQVQGHELDGRSDIFSLGTILYEITLGRRLWRGPKEVVMRRIVEEKPPPPTYIDRQYPPELELVVLRALEKRPDHRYATAGELFEDLEAYLVGAAARTRNHQIAIYLHGLFTSDAQVSDMGVRRAIDFSDEQEAVEDELDFDRPFKGAGKALADALRSSGPYVAAGRVADAMSVSPADAGPRFAGSISGSITTPSGEVLPVPLKRSVVDEPAAGAAAALNGAAELPPAHEPPLLAPPKRRRAGLVVGLLLASAAAAAGLLWQFI